MARFFSGTVANRIDAKQRVSVPASFRSTLAELGSPDTVVVYRAPEIDGLECCPTPMMEALVEEFESVERFSDRYDELQLILAESRELKLDREGRITLPDDLAQQNDLADEAVFIGQARKFYLCSKAVANAWTDAKLLRERAKVQARTSRAQDGGR